MERLHFYDNPSRPTGSSPKPQQEALQAFLEAPKAMASRGQKIIDSELDRIIT
jgi:hypothetical protein